MKYLITLLISMVPVIELRGALPVALFQYHMPWPAALLLCIAGNLLPVPFLVRFVTPVFQWIRKHIPFLDGFIGKLEQRGAAKGKKLEKGYFWGLFVLVAIPLPGTGAWTGSLVAAVLNMSNKKALPAIALGVVGAGLIVLTVCLLVRYGILSDSGLIAAIVGL